MRRKGIPRQLKDSCKLWLTGDYASVSNPLSGNSLYNDASLVRYYTMDDLTEKNGYNLTNVGCTSVSGKYGNAYSTGVGNSNNGMYNTTNVGINGGAVTITAWIKTLGNHLSASNYNFAVWESSPVNYVINGFTFNQNNTAVTFVRLRSMIVWQGPTYSFNATPGVWNHYACTYDGGTVRGYINGVLVVTGTASGNGTTDTARAFGVGIGDNITSVTVEATSVEVDDFSVFSRVLSASEIASIYGQSVAFDASGNGNHGTLMGSPTPKRLSQYKGFQFNGMNQYVNCGSSNFGVTGDFSIFAIVKCSSLNSEANIVGKDGLSEGRDFQFRFNGNGTITFFRGDTASGGYCNFSTTESFNDNKFHLVGVTFSSSEGSKIWVDGVVKATNSVLTGKNWSTSNMQIGARGDSTNLFTGTILQPVLFTKTLSPAEIKLDAINFFIPS